MTHLPRLRSLILPHLHKYGSFRQVASVAEYKKPTNRHVSIDAEGNKVETFTYVSEPLGNPRRLGYGWARLDFEEVVGRGIWVIKRKLGWSMLSSIWLAFDQKDEKYVAVKALKSSVNTRFTLEFEALQAVTITKTPSPYILKLRGAFNYPGRGNDGNHLCYAIQLHGGNVGMLNAAGQLPFPLAKRIMLHSLRGIAHMHKHGYIHTDIKLDNILFSCNMSDEEITSLLISDPSRRHDPEDSPDGIVQAAVSQPFPLPSFDEAMERTFLLGDFSHAQPLSERPPGLIAIPPHRPPETIIFSPWNEKTDIWQFGCLAYELITGHWLLNWEPRPEYKLTPEANLLYQMINVTGERFSDSELSKGQKTGNYFDSDGNLLSRPSYVDDSLSLKLKKLGHLSDADAASACELILRCLRLNPADRANAVDLLQDPFFIGVN